MATMREACLGSEWTASYAAFAWCRELAGRRDSRGDTRDQRDRIETQSCCGQQYVDSGSAGVGSACRREQAEWRRSDQSSTVPVMTSDGFVPVGFDPPTSLASDLFRLEPLGGQHNQADHAAWMSSIEHIRSTPGYPDGNWPPPNGMTLEENLSDLRRHADDFTRRAGFTFTVPRPRRQRRRRLRLPLSRGLREVGRDRAVLGAGRQSGSRRTTRRGR